MVRSTASTTTILTSSASIQPNQQQSQAHSSSSQQQLQSNDLTSLESDIKSNLERLKYFERSPIFIFPHILLFYPNDCKSFRREIKLVNPYDWRIRFKIFSTSPKKWEVNPPEGFLGPNCTLFISIRLLDTSTTNIGMDDHLRLTIKSEDGSTKLGNRDLPVLFLDEKNELQKQRIEQLYGLIQPFEEANGKPIASQPKESAKLTNSKQPSTSKNDTHGGTSGSEKKPRVENSWPPPFYMLVALVCGIVLCLPSEAESRFPTFMRVSNTPKFVAAYVLGILTSLWCKYY